MATSHGDEASTPTQATSQDEVAMSPPQRRFYASDECLTARIALQKLVDNPLYDTEASYYSGSELGFVDRHLHYLSTHPLTNIVGYISNLKLMTGLKRRS